MTRLVLPFLGALALLIGVCGSVHAQADGAAPPPADVVISPGDVLTVTVVGQPDLTRKVTVTADGKIPIAFVGEVKVAGMKPLDAAALIRKELSQYLREPEVTLDLIEANRASIYGRVIRPGTYALPAQARAMDLVQIAGGFEEAADRSRIRLLRKGNTIDVDLNKFATTGDLNANPPLQAGDVLNVPERATLAISVLGQVMRPGPIAAPLEAKVMDAVQMAGGFSERADRTHVTLQHAGAQVAVNLERYLATKDPADNPALQAGDTVTVPEKRMFSVTVLGQVTKPSVYQVAAGTTIAEAVALAGGVLPTADLSLAKLIHQDKTVAPVSLKDALENASAAANIPLQDGDTISIPKPPVERSFSVMGAVRAGGTFTMDRDQVTVVDALSRAGGAAPDANLKGAKIMRHAANGNVVTTQVDLSKLLKGERGTQMAMMGPGDVLYVEPKKEKIINRDTILGLAGFVASMIYIFK